MRGPRGEVRIQELERLATHWDPERTILFVGAFSPFPLSTLGRMGFPFVILSEVEDDDGNITHFLITSTPIMAWERPPRSEGPGVYVPIFILAVITILITLPSPFLGWAIRKWHRILKNALNW